MRRGLFGNRRRGGAWQQRGQALVEFTLVSLAFLFLTFGVFDLARMFQSWVTVQHASREAARYAITGQFTCDGTAGRNACITWTAKKATDGLARGGPSGSSPNLEVTMEAWDYDADAGTWLSSGVDGASGKECDQIEVTVKYKHKFSLPVLNAISPNGVDVVGRQRMTNEPYAPCDDEDGVA